MTAERPTAVRGRRRKLRRAGVRLAGVGSAGVRRPRARLAADVALAVVGVCFLLPLLWLVLASFDPRAGYETRWPQSPSFANFAAVLTPELLFRPMANSILLSAGTAALNLFAAVLAAYPLSRYRSRFNKPFLYAILFGTSLPVTAIMVPVYGLFVQLQLLDSMPATIL